MKQSLLDAYFRVKCLITDNHPGRWLNHPTLHRLAYPQGQEPESTKAAIRFIENVKRNVHPRPVVWDVGAHVGRFTLEIMRRVPECLVVAFEPNFQTLPALVANVSKLATVCVVPLALTRYGECGYASHTCDFRKTSVNRCKAISMGVVHAENVFLTPDLIKLDIEGGEDDLLPALIMHNVIVEWHRDPDKQHAAAARVWDARRVDATHSLLVAR